MKIIAIPVFVFLFYSLSYAQSESTLFPNIRKDSVYNTSKKIKFSFGSGLAVSEKYNELVISAEIFSTFKDSWAIGLGIDFYNSEPSPHKITPTINAYAAYNFVPKKLKFMEFYLGGGFEIYSGNVRALGLFRVDININPNFAIGLGLKQPLIYYNLQSAFDTHIYKLNLSYNFF
ncbi:MAG: hypothetical protein KBG21_00170 [Ignavibacteria bacterium]|nr:hypothetical protein [Ignavibacteria bacterium]